MRLLLARLPLLLASRSRAAAAAAAVAAAAARLLGGGGGSSSDAVAGTPAATSICAGASGCHSRFLRMCRTTNRKKRKPKIMSTRSVKSRRCSRLSARRPVLSVPVSPWWSRSVDLSSAPWSCSIRSWRSLRSSSCAINSRVRRSDAVASRDACVAARALRRPAALPSPPPPPLPSAPPSSSAALGRLELGRAGAHLCAQLAQRRRERVALGAVAARLPHRLLLVGRPVVLRRELLELRHLLRVLL